MHTAHTRPLPPARQRVLDILEATARGPGGWCSGEEISARLAISRAAVAKHVAQLRAEGHAIAAQTRRGYRLLVKRDRVDGTAVAALLSGTKNNGGTRCFGRSDWRILEVTASTNLEAAAFGNSGGPEGLVILAETQTAGRGRKGNTWISLPRGLQFSVLVRPEAPWWDAERMTERAARAVATAVTDVCGLEAVFKPPNDVLMGGKKLAGVLVETAMRGLEPEWAVIGVGCNVNALPEDFPPESADRFTSLLAWSGVAHDRVLLLAAILEEMEKAYVSLRD